MKIPYSRIREFPYQPGTTILEGDTLKVVDKSGSIITLSPDKWYSHDAVPGEHHTYCDHENKVYTRQKDQDLIPISQIHAIKRKEYSVPHKNPILPKDKQIFDSQPIMVRSFTVLWDACHPVKKEVMDITLEVKRAEVGNVEAVVICRHGSAHFAWQDQHQFPLIMVWRGFGHEAAEAKAITPSFCKFMWEHFLTSVVKVKNGDVNEIIKLINTASIDSGPKSAHIKLPFVRDTKYKACLVRSFVVKIRMMGDDQWQRSIKSVKCYNTQANYLLKRYGIEHVRTFSGWDPSFDLAEELRINPLPL